MRFRQLFSALNYKELFLAWNALVKKVKNLTIFSRLIVFAGVGAITTAIIMGVLWVRFLNQPLIPNNSNQLAVNFELVQGASVKTLANKLNQLKIMPHPTFFLGLAIIEGKSKALRAGEYSISPGITPSRLLNMMVKGEVVKHTFTIVEGWNFNQLKLALRSNAYLSHEVANLSDEEIMRKIGYEGVMPEGMFAPDTYVFSGKISDTMILRSAYHLMRKRLNAAWQARDTTVSYQYKCSYEALIVASMVEKESANAKERPLIAGVILHRLQVNMPLQIDATIIYGLGDKYQDKMGKISISALQQNTRYNTYMHKGLPPTPIAMPSQNALNAVFHPVIGQALYYVARGSSDGSHAFSNTLAEHDAARNKYLKK